MPQLQRIVFAGMSMVTIGALAVLHTRVAVPLSNRPEAQGPFSQPIQQAVTVAPLLIGALLVFVFVYALVGPVQEERTRNRKGPRRPPR